MGLFSRAKLDDLRAPLQTVLRLEAARHPAERHLERPPLGEERGRLFMLFAADQQLPPEELARRLVSGPDALTEEALAWRAGLDVDAELATFGQQLKPLDRQLRALLPEVLGYVGRGDKFGDGGPVDRLKPKVEGLGGYMAYAPSTRGFLLGVIEPGPGDDPVNRLTDELGSARFNYADFRGTCDKLWGDLTYVRPAALAYQRAIARHVLTGESAVESPYLRRALAHFNQTYDGDLERCLDDLEWWATAELAARRTHRLEVRRSDTARIIEDHGLSRAASGWDVYWVFDEVLAELEVMLALSKTSGQEQRLRARAIDHLIRFEPPASEAAFYYDQRLLLLEAHLSDQPAERLLTRLGRLQEFDDYHTLMRGAWAAIQRWFEAPGAPPSS